jgi:hypothetical protein
MADLILEAAVVLVVGVVLLALPTTLRSTQDALAERVKVRHARPRVRTIHRARRRRHAGSPAEAVPWQAMARMPRRNANRRKRRTKQRA